MIEFRWVVFLALWTLLIGPVCDFTQTAPHGRGKVAAQKRDAVNASAKNR
jgi:hypothetical protein